MSINTELRMWVPWCEFAQTDRGTADEFRAELRKYSRSSLLIACARLSIAFDFGPDGESAAGRAKTESWIPTLFPPQLAYRAQRLAQQNRVIFFQGQLRYLAAEVMRFDPAPSETLPSVKNVEIGPLLLRVVDLLYSKHPELTDKLDKMADMVARFVPVYEIDSPTDSFLPLMRFYIFLTINIPRVVEAGSKFDMPALFEKYLGFPLRIYCEFVYSFLMHAITERENRSTGALIDGGLRVSWFKETTVPVEVIERIFNTVCFTLDTPRPSKTQIGYADFEILKDTPYFKYDNVLYCLDYDYSLGKLESCALWRILQSLPPEDRAPYLSFWGHVFEDYVAWIFESYAIKKHNQFHSSPCYGNDPQKQICDAIVICGSTAVLIEAKLGTCPVDVKYSGDYQKMRKYMEERLVVGKERSVGVAQLLKVIEKITNSEPASLPTWLRGIKKFIPLIITRDEIGSCWAINSYLNARFEEKIKRKDHKGYVITPLVCMSVSTLERAVRPLQKYAFSTILEDRIKADHDLGRPFEAASRYVHRGTAKEMFVHIKILNNLTNELIADFGMKG